MNSTLQCNTKKKIMQTSWASHSPLYSLTPSCSYFNLFDADINNASFLTGLRSNQNTIILKAQGLQLMLWNTTLSLILSLPQVKLNQMSLFGSSVNSVLKILALLDAYMNFILLPRDRKWEKGWNGEKKSMGAKKQQTTYSKRRITIVHQGNPPIARTEIYAQYTESKSDCLPYKHAWTQQNEPS